MIFLFLILVVKSFFLETVLTQVQEQQEAAKLVGEISTNLVSVYTFNEREEIEKAKLEVGRITTEAKAKGTSQEDLEKSDAYKKAQQNLTALQASYDNDYGIGSTKGRAIQAVTAALQGIAGGSVEQAAVGLASPYLNEKIKEWTTDPTTNEVNKTANLMAHAILGAIEAEITGNHALAGAAAATTGEATAMIIAEKLYDKPADKLTEDEKKNVVFLSQVASGLASVFIANDGMASVAMGSEIGKRAVENNLLSLKDVHQYQKALKAAIQNGESIEEVHQKFKALSEKQRTELLANCDVTCRTAVPQELLGAIGFADELSGVLHSWLNDLPFDEQTKFYQLVESENAKTIEALKAQQSGLEKGIELAISTAHLFAKEDVLNQSSAQVGFAKKNSGKSYSPLPVPEPINVEFGDGSAATYKSNSKHTKGMIGNRKNAGIEPRNSLELFKNSIEYKVESNKVIRYAKDLKF
ncbi:Possible hemagglutinin (DUF638) [[Pasteurella] mairii]|uniref:Possible hemagglutinin (DUF638) n=1 Tax=[Pasteurella] mairii TaxID=757 RepID=A0A379B6T4_9PAST|nr:Possible hemagglutinin (DUF638) [[Pasteurella] mairii]